MAERSLSPGAIEAEIERIRALGLEALRSEWRMMYGASPPAGLTKEIMARMMAYRIQEQVFGGLDRAATRLLERLARGEKPGTEPPCRLKAGTVILREYQGERHTVTVVPNGFVWQGATYTSLSTIAKAITGTAWSGPRFFGLRSGADRIKVAPPVRGTSPPHNTTRQAAGSSARQVQRGSPAGGEA
jgi:hypothetical protein